MSHVSVKVIKSWIKLASLFSYQSWKIFFQLHTGIFIIASRSWHHSAAKYSDSLIQFPTLHSSYFSLVLKCFFGMKSRFDRKNIPRWWLNCLWKFQTRWSGDEFAEMSMENEWNLTWLSENDFTRRFRRFL